MNLLQEVYQIKAMMQNGDVKIQELIRNIAVTLACKLYLVNPHGEITVSSTIENNLTLENDFCERLKLLESDVTNIPIAEGFIKNTTSDQPVQIICVTNLGKFGNLIFAKQEAFNEEELIFVALSSFAVFVCMKQKSTRFRPSYKAIISSLTHSEIQLLKKVFQVIPRRGGVFRASVISEDNGISPSQMSHGLKQLESIGIITKHSLGRTGTYINILDPEFIDHLLQERG